MITADSFPGDPYGWTDSYYTVWSAKPHHPKKWPYLAPILALVFLVK